MARDGVLDHVDRDGLDPTGRAEVFGLHGWRALGENIARYEAQFGPIKEGADTPPPTVGFVQ